MSITEELGVCTTPRLVAGVDVPELLYLYISITHTLIHSITRSHPRISIRALYALALYYNISQRHHIKGFHTTTHGLPNREINSTREFFIRGALISTCSSSSTSAPPANPAHSFASRLTTWLMCKP